MAQLWAVDCLILNTKSYHHFLEVEGLVIPCFLEFGVFWILCSDVRVVQMFLCVLVVWVEENVIMPWL